MMDAVIQFARLDIYQVYKMPAMEFFAYVQYVAAREKKKADDIKKIQRS